MALTNIGRYQITGELGKGAMGVVYKATDPNIGREVAIKTTRIDTHGIDEHELLKRFRNEARAAGTLNHPNIVTIFDAGEDNGLFYIAMEFIEGTTLQKVLQQSRVLSAQQVVDYGVQICSALEYAHAHGVVHRDIKPANIMITGTGTVKIMDFGIAKAGGGMTSTGQVLGTPNYMSPEQVKGRAVDGRSDIFSTGVVLYEALTGEKPFDGQNVTTIIYKIVNEMPISPRALDSGVHPGMSLVILKALAKSPDERYQGGAELSRDLVGYKTLGVEGGDTQVLSTPTYISGAETLMSSGPLTVTSLRESTGPTSAPAAGGTPAQAAQATAMKQVGETVVQPAAAVPSPVAPAKPASAAKAPKATAGMSRPLKLALVWTPLFVIVIGAGLLFRARQRHQEPAPQPVPQVEQQQVQQAPTPEPPAADAAATGAQSDAPATGAPATQDAAAPVTPTPEDLAKEQRDQKRKLAAQKAAAEKAAALQVGDLHVTSTPAGASVAIDGKHDPAWVTPFTAAKLPVGAKTLVFSKQGYSTKDLKMEIVGAKAVSVDAQLAQALGMINVHSTPAGAEIVLDDKPTGKTTPALLTVSPGEHSIKLTKDGFDPAASTVKVAESQRVEYGPTLNAVASAPAQQKKQNVFSKIFGKGENGTLTIRVTPAAAKIDVSGPEKKSMNGPGKFELKPGKYEVTIWAEGYKPLNRSVSVEKGKSLGIEETLEKQ